jgi:chromosome segregation ATPase
MRSIYLILISALLIAPSVFSEETPLRGKLADGTPFRTDSEGNQIVDYIAELENSVDYLNQRVVSLEDELKSKQDSLERISSSKTSNSKFQERDIVDRSDQRPAFPNSAELEAKRNLEAKLAQAEGLNTELREELEIQGAKLKSVSAQLRSNNNSGLDLTNELENLKANYEVKLSAEQDKLKELEARILERERDIKDLNQQIAEQQEDSQLKIVKLEKSLAEAGSINTQQVADLKRQLAEVRAASRAIFGLILRCKI